jgi:dienelactone hydrolase
VIVLGAIAFVLTTAPEHVSFASRDEGVTLTAFLFRPDGAGPFPAVVLLHGCGGLTNEKGALLPRHAEWAALLRDRGYVVLLPDSFGPRGVKGICKNNDAKIRPTKERARDALGALDFLQSRRDVDPARIGLMGWSNGATTVLATIAASLERPARDFAVAIALYPACGGLQRKGYATKIPATILIGEKDDWNPASACESLAAEAKLSIRVYPGALHDFDAPASEIRTLETSSGLVTIGTDERARTDALDRVPKILAAALKN